MRAALIVAVCGSAMAGLVHAAAARAHEGDRLLVWMFVLCAAAQLAWAAVVVLRPRRVVLVAGVVINGGAVLVWALTRTVGISFVDSLAEVETVGTQDLAAAPTGPIVSLDDPRMTPAQRAIAVSLIDGVKSALSASRFPNVAAVTGAGYQWIGDGAGGGYQHYVNWTYYSDGIELNPSKIESIVVKDGKVVSGMYILNTGKTMANVPTLAGPLTTWHDHQNLCFSGTQLVGIAVDGKCAKGVLTPTPPMLHVWLVVHPCGPFAGIESHGGDCGVHEH